MHMVYYNVKYLARNARAFPSQVRRSSVLSLPEQEKTREWIASQNIPVKQAPMTDYITASQLRALGCTLPTLDGTISPPPHRRVGISMGSTLPPGHLLVFCNPSAPERELESDATIRLSAPPAPFLRRMWASGKFEFKHPVRVGDTVQAQGAISKIEPKRLDAPNPMIIIEQTIETKLIESSVPSDFGAGAGRPGDICIIEKRSHVYLPLTNERRHGTFRNLPEPDFSFSYTPTDTTLFRFSALTFNAHRIHIDKDYAQNIEKLPERLVHGPMTALMLMEVIELNRPAHLRIATFEYRATNQLFVDRPITIHGSWLTDRSVHVRAQTEDQVVGMMGEARMEPLI